MAIDDGNEWWRGATIYQIYPRSFLDTTGSGVGDLQGVVRKLPYVRDLGVDAIWLSPFFTSPMKDFGYDVSDFRDVDPLFGTLEDFDSLLAAAHQHGLPVVIDQVYSHSSSEHPWFQASRRDRSNDKSDWYVWAEPGPDGGEPNNWQSVFGGPSWAWSDARQQYYLHNFLAEQPDLNLHNDAVQSEILAIARFWLDRGVAGFRLDALHCLMHDEALRDNPPRETVPPATSKPYLLQEHVYDHGHPRVPQFLERFRALTNEYDAVFTVAEVGSWNPLPLMRDYAAPSRLHSAYSFDFLAAKQIDARHICETISAWPNEPESGWPSWAFSNHDAPRVATRWGGSEPADDKLKLFALLQVSLRGNVFVYQGEELGLSQADIPFDRLLDPEAIANWPDTLGRDGARTPMPWCSGASNAGFSSGEPWLPIDPAHTARSVETQVDRPDSVLAYFRQAIKLRQSSHTLRQGDLRFLDSPPGTLAFLRSRGNDSIVCMFNLSEKAGRIDLQAVRYADTLLHAGTAPSLSAQGHATLDAWSGCLVAINKS